MKASDASLLMTIFCLSSGKHKKQFTLEGKKKKKNQPGGMCLNIVNLVFDFHRVIPHIYSTRAHQEKTAFFVTCIYLFTIQLKSEVFILCSKVECYIKL